MHRCHRNINLGMKAQAATSGDTLAIPLLRNLQKVENISMQLSCNVIVARPPKLYCMMLLYLYLKMREGANWELQSLNPAPGSGPRHLDRRVQLMPIGGISLRLLMATATVML